MRWEKYITQCCVWANFIVALMKNTSFRLNCGSVWRINLLTCRIFSLNPERKAEKTDDIKTVGFLVSESVAVGFSVCVWSAHTVHSYKGELKQATQLSNTQNVITTETSCLQTDAEANKQAKSKNYIHKIIKICSEQSCLYLQSRDMG